MGISRLSRRKLAIPSGWNAAMTSTAKAISVSLARFDRGLRPMTALQLVWIEIFTHSAKSETLCHGRVARIREILLVQSGLGRAIAGRSNRCGSTSRQGLSLSWPPPLARRFHHLLGGAAASWPLAARAATARRTQRRKSAIKDPRRAVGPVPPNITPCDAGRPR